MRCDVGTLNRHDGIYEGEYIIKEHIKIYEILLHLRLFLILCCLQQELQSIIVDRDCVTESLLFISSLQITVAKSQLKISIRITASNLSPHIFQTHQYLHYLLVHFLNSHIEMREKQPRFCRQLLANITQLSSVLTLCIAL